MKGKKGHGLVGPRVCGLFSTGIAAWAWLFCNFFSILLDLDLNVMKKLDMIFYLLLIFFHGSLINF